MQWFSKIVNKVGPQMFAYIILNFQYVKIILFKVEL